MQTTPAPRTNTRDIPIPGVSALVPYHRGDGARSSRLTPGYIPCRLTACGCCDVTTLHGTGVDTGAALIRTHTMRPHPRGVGARSSRLTPGYIPCRLTACGCHDVMVIALKRQNPINPR
ncbi:MAG: hypothetical protein J5644_05410 [Bacteroidales bacterium]|nr:hypothetical protein [Bacteroidales bacterium]